MLWSTLFSGFDVTKQIFSCWPLTMHTCMPHPDCVVPHCDLRPSTVFLIIIAVHCMTVDQWQTVVTALTSQSCIPSWTFSTSKVRCQRVKKLLHLWGLTVDIPARWASKQRPTSIQFRFHVLLNYIVALPQVEILLISKREISTVRKCHLSQVQP